MLIDKVLGNFEERYFGAGHKRSVYSLYKAFETDEDNYQGSASIELGSSWSEKNGEQIRPHLSTIDGVVLAALLAEKYLEEKHPEIATKEMFLSMFEIKAGGNPIEDLQNITLSIKKVSVEAEIFNFKIDILGMKVNLKIRKIENNYTDLEQIASSDSSDRGYIAYHLKDIRHDIDNINFLNQNNLFCDFIRGEEMQTNYSGLSCNFSKSISALEWLVVFSQMGQLVAYNYDFIDRRESHNLWMRWVKAELKSPYFYEEPILMTGEIVKASLLNRGEDKWRTFDVAGSTIDNNVKFEGKMAHKLPRKKEESHGR